VLEPARGPSVALPTPHGPDKPPKLKRIARLTENRCAPRANDQTKPGLLPYVADVAEFVDARVILRELRRTVAAPLA
jgi:hypothetical protein